MTSNRTRSNPWISTTSTASAVKTATSGGPSAPAGATPSLNLESEVSAPTALTSAANPANPATNPANPDTPADLTTAETPAETAEAPAKAGNSGKSWIEQMEQDEEEDLLRVDTNVEETDFGDGRDDDALLDLDKATVPQVNSHSRMNRFPDHGSAATMKVRRQRQAKIINEILFSKYLSCPIFHFCLSPLGRRTTYDFRTFTTSSKLQMKS